MIRDLGIIVAAFLGASAIAGLLGAANLGTALAFGQLAFALAVVLVIVRR
jgi:ABC-type methionine transport system permease subunit